MSNYGELATTNMVKNIIQRAVTHLHLWLPFLLLLGLNLFLAAQTWEEIRQNFSWVKAVPQSDIFKLRHFVLLSPLAFFATFAAHQTMKFSYLKTTNTAFSLGLCVAILSEYIQSFIPQRIASYFDVFSNIVAVAFGILVYWGGYYFFQKMRLHRLSSYRDDIPFLFVAILLAVLFRLNFFDAPVFSDSWRLLTAFYNPDSGSAKYWLHIFTQPTNGPQYRPISFFFVFFVNRALFGDELWPYRAFGIILIIGILTLLYFLLKELTKSRWLSFFGILFFTTHASTHYLSLEIAHAERYFLPLFDLVLGLFLIYRAKHTQQGYIFFLLVLTTLAIMSHEGAFVFPFIFVMCDWALGRVLSKKHLILLVPSAVYLVSRLFYFGVPNEGFMKVNVIALPLFLSKYLYYAFVPDGVFSSQSTDMFVVTAGALFLSFIILIVSYHLIKGSNKQLAFWGITILFVLSPFCVLENHFGKDRVLWAIVPLTVFLALFAEKLNLLKEKLFLHKKMFQVGIIFYLTIALFFQLKSAANAGGYYLKKGVVHKQLKMSISQQIAENKKQAYYISGFFENPWIFTHVFAGFLAFHFPRQEFVLIDSQKNEVLAYVNASTYFNSDGQGGWTDPFGYPAVVSLPEPSVKIEVETGLIYPLFK